MYVLIIKSKSDLKPTSVTSAWDGIADTGRQGPRANAHTHKTLNIHETGELYLHTWLHCFSSHANIWDDYILACDIMVKFEFLTRKQLVESSI